MKVITWILLLLCIVPSSCFAVGTLEIYVRNKPLQGETMQKGDELYVSAQELKKLFKEKIEWDTATGVISLDGQATALRILQGRNGSLVPLRALAKCAGYDVSYNKSTGIMDVFKKTALKKDPVPLSVTPPASASAPSEAEGKKKDLLTIQGIGASAVVASTQETTQGTNSTLGNPNSHPIANSPGNQPNTGSPEASHMVYSPGAGYHTGKNSTNTDQGLRLTAVVTNGRPTEARNIVATCVLKTQDGGVFTQQEQRITDLKPGGKLEVLFYFPAAGGGLNLQPSYMVRGD